MDQVNKCVEIHYENRTTQLKEPLEIMKNKMKGYKFEDIDFFEDQISLYDTLTANSI